ncbi:hypothetical protein KKG61_09780 [bacterium]|nr:hypothetical protein [Patescibacteria group bacterium]MBU1600373.1 hypothetical protein [bacterium]MBU2416427.1 hypothetical protein [Patescibacteria group bacterium]
MSSWGKYIGNKQNKKDKQNDQYDFCEKEIVLGQFKNVMEYKEFAENSLKDIQENKEVARMLLE